jgi:hypothetical protein
MEPRLYLCRNALAARLSVKRQTDPSKGLTHIAVYRTRAQSINATSPSRIFTAVITYTYVVRLLSFLQG